MMKMSLKKKMRFFLALLLTLYTVQAGADEMTIEACEACTGHVIDRNDAVSVVAGTHKITLCDVVIDVSESSNECAFMIYPGAEVFLTVEGRNILSSGEGCAGIQVSRGAKLCIQEESTGSLTAMGGMYSAGIGGKNGQNAGTIDIRGGTVIANSLGAHSSFGAAIGGGEGCGYEAIRISGGTVYTAGYAVGIGGECQTVSGTIEISGGIVYAVADEIAIGSLLEDSGHAILISGGEVYADGGYQYAIGCGTGITRFNGGKVYTTNAIRINSEEGELLITDSVISVNGVLQRE